MSPEDEEREDQEEEQEETEQEETEESEEGDEEVKSEGDDETAEKTDHQFDKDRQQEQQELANAKRRLEVLENEVAQGKYERDTARAKAQADADAAEEIEDPIALIKEMRSKIQNLEQAANVDKETREAQAEAAGYDAFQAQCKKAYGEKYHTEAIRLAAAEAQQMGYALSGANTPDFTTTCQLIEKGYLRAKLNAAEAGGKKTGGKKVVKGGKVPNKGSRLDTSQTGSTGREPLGKQGTHEEVLADMKSKGRLKNLTTDDDNL